MLHARRLAVAGLLAVALTAPSTAALAGGREKVVPGPRDTYGVGRRVLDLVDTSRATPADPKAQHQPIAASAVRTLPTTVFYPTDPDAGREPIDDAEPAAGRFPVVLFSHGAPGSPDDYQRMLERWASEGYVVIAPQYPVSSTAGPTDVAWEDARDQIRDAEFVLSRALARNTRRWREGGFGGRLDKTRIGAAGHSMGGLTTLALVSNCCRDERVKAALVLAGVSKGEDGPRIVDPRAPIMFVHAALDIAVPFSDSERAYGTAGDPRYLVELRVPIPGVLAHLLPVADSYGSISRGVHRAEDRFLAAYVGGDAEAAAGIADGVNGDDDFRFRSDS